MDSVFLTFREKRLLFFMRFKKKVKPRFDVRQFVSYGLICPNYFSQKSAIGTFEADGTYSLTDAGKRHFIQRRESFFTKRLPVMISLAALVKSFWLEIKTLAKWIIEAVGQAGN